MTSEQVRRVLAAIRCAGGESVPSLIDSNDSLVLRLGFDSMKMVLLSVALENEFGAAIALDGWIGSHRDPGDLTVSSLCRYLEECLGVDEPATVSV